jgi:hypothetical protein
MKKLKANWNEIYFWNYNDVRLKINGGFWINDKYNQLTKLIVHKIWNVNNWNMNI